MLKLIFFIVSYTSYNFCLKIALFQDDGHSDWVSCVRYSPDTNNPLVVSGGWDRNVKVWDMTNCRIKTNHNVHEGFINTVTISPDGSLCASGGKVKETIVLENKFYMM